VVKGETTVFACFDQVTTHPDGTVTVLDYVREHAERIDMADGSSLQAEQFLERFLFPRSMQSTPLERLSGASSGGSSWCASSRWRPTSSCWTSRQTTWTWTPSGCSRTISASSRAACSWCPTTGAAGSADGLPVRLRRTRGHPGFTGSYADYRDLLTEETPSDARPVGRTDSRNPRERKIELSFRERREFEELEREIAELEGEQKQIEAYFTRTLREAAERERSDRRYREIEGLLEAKLARWEVLAARAGG